MTRKCDECRREITTRGGKCQCGYRNAPLEALGVDTTSRTASSTQSADHASDNCPPAIGARFAELSLKLDEIKRALAEQRKANADLQKENVALQAMCRAQAKEIDNLKGRVNDLEQYKRINNVIIKEVPLQRKENVEERVIAWARAVGVVLSENDIDECHRLPARKANAAPNVVVKLVCRKKKARNIVCMEEETACVRQHKRPIHRPNIRRGAHVTAQR